MTFDSQPLSCKQSSGDPTLSDPERLNKYLARCGAASRRKAEEFIRAGRVRVNGIPVTDLSTQVEPGRDIVELDGVILNPPGKYTYYMVNKPRGYVSTVEDPHAGRKVVDLVPEKPRVFPVGRLDKDSEGLMILTDDGDLALSLTHPRFEHEKEYMVTVESPEPASGTRLREGIRNLSEKSRRPVKLLQIVNEWETGALLRIILTEGKKRQIRRMCFDAGLKVMRLVRIRIGKLQLGDLPPGKYRKIDRCAVI